MKDNFLYVPIVAIGVFCFVAFIGSLANSSNIRELRRNVEDLNKQIIELRITQARQSGCNSKND